LGAAYKRDIDDYRESPALDVMAELLGKGARLNYHDPYVPHIEAREWPGGVDLASVPLSMDALAAADCVVILTNHTVFDYTAILSRAKLIVDTRNAIKSHAPHVFKLGAGRT
jgi:UDP-N-acetyl-D-glucosamine dehydrogenase